MSSSDGQRYVLRDHAPILGRMPDVVGVVECRCVCGERIGSQRDTRDGEDALMDAWSEHADAPARVIPSIRMDGTRVDRCARASLAGTIRSNMSFRFPAMVHSRTG